MLQCLNHRGTVRTNFATHIVKTTVAGYSICETLKLIFGFLTKKGVHLKTIS